jgi:UDP-N-acetylglucosamine 2-epimerase (non-hydrolysing)
MLGLAARISGTWPVVGDVNSTLAAALVAAKAGVFVAHVEAGLRSRDSRVPEEINRGVTDRVSDYLLAPSGDPVANLRAKGYREDQIHLVGNVMVDASRSEGARSSAPDPRRPRSTSGRVRSCKPPPAGERRPGRRPARPQTPFPLEGRTPLVLLAHRRLAAASAASTPARCGVAGPQGYLDFVASKRVRASS